MGHKTHPKGFRLKITEDWDASWFTGWKNFGDNLVEDIQIRRLLLKELDSAQVSNIKIQRFQNTKVVVNVWVVRVGIAAGKGGSKRDELLAKLKKIVKSADQVHLDFYEENKPNLKAATVAQNVVQQLEKRINYRRAMKQSIKRSLQDGAKGVKIVCSGRLNGAEMSRSDKYREGRVPLHTLRANINYSCLPAKTIYGTIGVKVWIYTGDTIPRKRRPDAVKVVNQ